MDTAESAFSSDLRLLLIIHIFVIKLSNIENPIVSVLGSLPVGRYLSLFFFCPGLESLSKIKDGEPIYS